MGRRGLFITIEGIEGAGKSTLARALARRISRNGREVVLTAEPGATALGRAIRGLVLSPTGPRPVAMAELMLFLADRAQHVAEVIAPALEAGRSVVCDRFSDSTLAYQGVARALGLEWVRGLCDRVSGGLVPDITFVIDLPVAEAMARAGLSDRIEGESVEFHERVREGFLAIANAEPERVRVLDGRLKPALLEAQAWEICRGLLENHEGSRG